eukprot:4375795-Amphidinium_carterae.1
MGPRDRVGSMVYQMVCSESDISKKHTNVTTMGSVVLTSEMDFENISNFRRANQTSSILGHIHDS